MVRYFNRHIVPRPCWLLHLVLPFLMVLAACSGVPVRMNQPLPDGPDGRPNFAANYGPSRLLADYANESGTRTRGDSDLLVFLAFSGGGKRSSAFSHGALRGLRTIAVAPPGRTPWTLLDDVDFIAGVSGGSFTAAHYGLYRERHFDTFGRDFLYRDIDVYLYRTYIYPWNWGWLVNPRVGSNDYMAEVYDRLLFHGATYADLLTRGAPVISVNATDYVNGMVFPFLSTSFGAICSDLNSFHLARAVAASAAFPFLFSPVTLENHAAQCRGLRPPDGLPNGTNGESGPLSRRAALVRAANAYADPEHTRWIHLMDGGLADNLALRGILQLFVALDDDHALIQELARRTRRILVLSVDGQAAVDQRLSQRQSISGVRQILNATYYTQVDAYNFETRVLMTTEVQNLARRFARIRCRAPRPRGDASCEDVAGSFVHVSLADIAEEETRLRLQSTETGVSLSARDTADLVAQGESLVRDHPDIRRLVAEAALRLAVRGAAQPASSAAGRPMPASR